MATNIYFNNFTYKNEQLLQEDLIIESIRQYGVNAYYIPRLLIKRDNIFREPQVEKFSDNFELEVYVENITGFSGDGEFFSKFGIQSTDQIVFSIAQRTYFNEVGIRLTGSEFYVSNRKDMPSEGDLIWIPMFGVAYQVQFVDHKAIFFQLGNLPTYKLTCQVFEYSNQIFDTGLTDLDAKYNELYSGNSVANTDIELVDIQAMNTVIETESDAVVFFTDSDFEGRSF